MLNYRGCSGSQFFDSQQPTSFRFLSKISPEMVLTFAHVRGKIRHMANTRAPPFLYQKLGIISLGLILLSSLSLPVFTRTVVAASDELRWSRANIPADGSTGNWVLADTSDVQHLTMAVDGTLYHDVRAVLSNEGGLDSVYLLP